MLSLGLGITSPQFRPFSPSQLFQQGEQGVVLAPSSLGTMFQDAQGQLPVTGPGDPVGLMLDTSQGVDVKPLAQSLGSELWDDVGVTVGSGWAENGGVYSHTSGIDTVRDDVGLQTGKAFLVSGLISSRTAGTLQPVLGGDSSGGLLNTNGPFEQVIVSGSNSLAYFQPTSDFDGSISNISVREIQPLSERITGLGPELVTNGAFDSDSDWTKGAGWTISGGQAHHTGPGGALTQHSAAFQAGRLYLITVSVVSYSSGSAYIGSLGGSNALTGIPSQVGTHTFYVTPPDNGVLYLGLSAYEASIDNISVREIPGHHAVQDVNDDFRPALQVDGVGNYCLDFDGIDDFMTVDFGQTLAQPNTVSAAFERTSGSGTEYLFDGIDVNRHALFSDASDAYVFSGSTALLPTRPDGREVATVSFSGAGGSFRLSGAQSTVSTGTNPISGITLGARYSQANHFTGRFYGLVTIDRALTMSEPESLERYLADKAGVIL